MQDFSQPLARERYSSGVDEVLKLFKNSRFV